MWMGTYYLTPTSKNFQLLIPIKRIIVSTKSKFQTIEVVETNLGIAMVLDGLLQVLESDEYIYHESFVHPALINTKNARNVLIIGGGDGCAAREVLKNKNIKKITMVDIDNEVIKISKKYLKRMNKGSLEDKKVKIIIEDGRKFLKETKEKFDVIFVDVTDPTSTGPSLLLYSREFYELAKERMNKGGVLVTQATVFGSEQYIRIYSTIKSVFGNAYCLHSYVKSFGDDWGFVMAYKDEEPGILKDKEEVEKFMKKIIRGKLRYLNGDTYLALFAIPNEIREKIERGGKIIEDREAIEIKKEEVQKVWAFES